jgi:hypothetical protein
METADRIGMMNGGRFISHEQAALADAGESLIGRLRRFIEDSPLTFYQIASLIGTSGTILSMWIAGTARPHTMELIAIDRLLKGASCY